ncbi:hypothetical protein KIN20_008062 [Parelaphostrongylus tenuis]|uniref:Uncharacterized protein n=1 Tax=Parelaphostrongylus tenuis TaxID=148309 RepID=A0AAD5M7E7_PARTN|nr:hypothetical protein KIN20_008062 [Parelaphostrongylus tenuis]
MEPLRNDLDHSRVRNRDMRLHYTECAVKIFVLSARHRYCEKLTATQAHPPYQRIETFIKVFDVLERQGRSALLPDSVISSILNQLEVRITYEPLQCQRIVLDIMKDLTPEPKMGDQYCIIASNTVTGICTALMTGQGKKCSMTTNIIMATWSRMMWQNVMDRAVRILASGPFRSHFIAATGTIGGN